MTGPEHYREAEQLLRSDPEAGTAVVERRIARAQVHAILALAAATAIGAEGPDAGPWHQAAATRLSGSA
jgi:hypothetical protein